MTGIIDFRAYVPLPQFRKALVESPEMGRYVERYPLPSAEALTTTPDHLVARMDVSGIDHTVLAGMGLTNDEISEYVGKQPGRLTGIASVSPKSGLMGAVREVRRCYELGFRLVTMRPIFDGLRASDKLYYPVYATCAELGMAVVLHTASNFGRGMKLDVGRPLHLDDVAIDFPELVIVASHGGWPWVAEMVAVAWHHDNVYIELSGQRAVHMAKEGSGWEPIFNYGSGPLSSRLLWGSASPMLDLERQLSETQDLPFCREAISSMLDANPRQLLSRLGIEVSAAVAHS